MNSVEKERYGSGTYMGAGNRLVANCDTFALKSVLFQFREKKSGVILRIGMGNADGFLFVLRKLIKAFGKRQKCRTFTPYLTA